MRRKFCYHWQYCTFENKKLFNRYFCQIAKYFWFFHNLLVKISFLHFESTTGTLIFVMNMFILFSNLLWFFWTLRSNTVPHHAIEKSIMIYCINVIISHSQICNYVWYLLMDFKTTQIKNTFSYLHWFKFCTAILTKLNKHFGPK